MREGSRSTLHLQLGQETIYLLLTAALFAAVVMATILASQAKPHEEPPIITLSEADGFFFQTGSAALSKQFESRLESTVVPRLVELAIRYDASVIEVIGHTDEVPLRRGQTGNLDRTLVDWFAGRSTMPPTAADNMGLGMARAVSVARALRSSGLKAPLTVVPMSAGPFLKPDDTVTDGSSVVAAEKRRRIEIRLRRSRQ